MKIEKSFIKGTPSRGIAASGLMSYCSWDRLKPFLEDAIGLKEHEQLIGIEASDKGITAVIGFKETILKDESPKSLVNI